MGFSTLANLVLSAGNFLINALTCIVYKKTIFSKKEQHNLQRFLRNLILLTIAAAVAQIVEALLNYIMCEYRLLYFSTATVPLSLIFNLVITSPLSTLFKASIVTVISKS